MKSPVITLLLLTAQLTSSVHVNEDPVASKHGHGAHDVLAHDNNMKSHMKNQRKHKEEPADSDFKDDIKKVEFEDAASAQATHFKDDIKKVEFEDAASANATFQAASEGSCLNTKVLITSYRGRRLSHTLVVPLVPRSGALSSNAKQWEEFTITDAGHGRVYIRDYEGKFLEQRGGRYIWQQGGAATLGPVGYMDADQQPGRIRASQFRIEPDYDFGKFKIKAMPHDGGDDDRFLLDLTGEDGQQALGFGGGRLAISKAYWIISKAGATEKLSLQGVAEELEWCKVDAFQA